MKIKHLFSIGLVAVLMCALLTSCGKDDDTPSNPNNGGTEKPSNNDNNPNDPHSNPTPGNDVQPPQGAVSVAEAVQYVNSVTTASTDATDIVLKGTCSESEIKELAQSISKGKSAINLDLSNCEVQSINFEGCANLQEVTLPVNVQIPDRAFADCPNLKVVYIGNDEEDNSQSLSKSFFDELIEDPWDFINPYIANFRANVGKEAFLNDWMLEEIYVKSASCKVIGERAFKGCRKLQIVQLGHVCVIEEDAFNGCESLAGIMIPATVSRLAVSAFANCPKLTKGKVRYQSVSEWYGTDNKNAWLEYKMEYAGPVVVISDFDFQSPQFIRNPNVEKATQYLFHGKTHKNPQAKSIDLLYDEGLVTFVFDLEYSDDELIELRNKIMKHPNLKVKLYASWKHFGPFFAGLSNLIYVEMPYAESINLRAFENCSNLKEIVAPNVAMIGRDAFTGCPNDVKINVGRRNEGNWYETYTAADMHSMSGGVELEETPIWTMGGKFWYWKKEDVLNRSYTYAALPNAINALQNNKKYSIKVTGTYVDNMDFRNALSNRNDDNIELYLDFTSVSGMTKVPQRFCWDGRQIVYGVKLPADVKEIGQDAFTNCKKLKTFELPLSVEKIGMIAFTGCGLESDLVLPSTLTEIGQGAFLNAFTGNAKPVFSNVSEDGINQDGKMWYAKDANTDAEIKYDQWKNTEWWNVQSYSFYTKKSTDMPYNPVTGDGYVDLGLPSGTLWATCNVGAQNPWDYGDYFAWGETRPKDKYDWGTYKYSNSDSDEQTKYCNKSGYGYNGFTDNLTVLLPEDDAATANLGKDWRMPTQAEFQELYDNCDWEWTSNYNGTGVAGRIVKSRITSTSIFFPAAGNRIGSDLNFAGSYGYYWSSSLDTADPNYGLFLYFYSGDADPGYWCRRRCGQSVRAVRCR